MRLSAEALRPLVDLEWSASQKQYVLVRVIEEYAGYKRKRAEYGGQRANPTDKPRPLSPLPTLRKLPRGHAVYFGDVTARKLHDGGDPVVCRVRSR
jgi:hypothetical protein